MTLASCTALKALASICSSSIQIISPGQGYKLPNPAQVHSWWSRVSPCRAGVCTQGGRNESRRPNYCNSSSQGQVE
jgi:hypothetical protein